jgi:hypothetical protein
VLFSAAYPVIEPKKTRSWQDNSIFQSSTQQVAEKWN